jgi:hypothetical protein
MDIPLDPTITPHYLIQFDGVYCFSNKSHINKKHPNWSIPLPNLTPKWHELCLEGVLVPGHNTHSSVCNSTANFVSPANLIWECPHSLLTALADKHPDRDIWMRSFWEEKDSIISMDTYHTITFAQYCALREKGAPQAIPTMCILTIKPDKMMNPHRAKSCIVILGNCEERIWSKSDKYAPVLRPDTMRLIVSMAVEQQHTLQQGNYKNAFCQGSLPPDEITIVKPLLVIQTLRKMSIGC